MSVEASRSRRFDARDGLILVTATIAAALIVYVRSLGLPPGLVMSRDVVTGPTGEDAHRQPEGAVFCIIRQVTDVSRPFPMTWTPAIAVPGLRRPRLPRRRLFRRPGMAACAAATPVLVGVIVGHVLMRAWAVWTAQAILAVWTMSPVSPGSIAGPATPVQQFQFKLGSIVTDAAYAEDAIAGAWLIMALGGWWRPERGWIDRLGRALGAAWLVLMAVGFVAGCIE
jgi:hypothetical protein